MPNQQAEQRGRSRSGGRLARRHATRSGRVVRALEDADRSARRRRRAIARRAPSRRERARRKRRTPGRRAAGHGGRSPRATQGSEAAGWRLADGHGQHHRRQNQRPSRAWTVDPMFTTRGLDTLDNRHRLGQRRPRARVHRAAQPPRRAAEREVGHGGEALLVGAQREQQVRDAVGRTAAPGSGTCTHQQNTRRPPGAHEHRARLADEPDAERAALRHQPGPRVQLARVVADEVAEQAERHPLGRVLALRLRPHARWRRAARRAPGSPTRARAARSRPGTTAAPARTAGPPCR